MTSFPLPAQEPSRQVKRITGIGAVIGALVITGWLVGWLFANASSVKVDKFDPYTWRSGSAIYLASIEYKPVSCMVSPRNGQTRSVRIDSAYPKWAYLNVLAINGVRFERWFSGEATVTCDARASLSSGPVLWLYPLGYTAVVPIVAIALVVVWWKFGRRKARQTRPDAMLGLATMLTRRRRR
jgi:hypothetical protein